MKTSLKGWCQGEVHFLDNWENVNIDWIFDDIKEL